LTLYVCPVFVLMRYEWILIGSSHFIRDQIVFTFELKFKDITLLTCFVLFSVPCLRVAISFFFFLKNLIHFLFQVWFARLTLLKWGYILCPQGKLLLVQT
jgi:hypothetical protein